MSIIDAIFGRKKDLTMCKPCAVEYGEKKKITPYQGKANKDTCDICGRRRYCLIYKEE